MPGYAAHWISIHRPSGGTQPAFARLKINAFALVYLVMCVALKTILGRDALLRPDFLLLHQSQHLLCFF